MTTPTYTSDMTDSGEKAYLKAAQKLRALLEKRSVNRTLTVLGALLVGVANGLFGGGGGMLVVPIFTLLCGLEQDKAHATAVAAILPLSLVSGIIYITNGNFEVSTGLWTTVGVVLGGIAGAKLLVKMSSRTLSLLFYGLMLAAGIKLIIG